MKISALIKIFIGILFVVIVLAKVDFNTLYLTLKDINLWLYLCTIPNYLLAMLLGTLKWKSILPKQNYIKLLKANLVSTYYSIFVPGQLATEGIKALRLGQNPKQRADIYSSIFLDKVIGFIALIIISLLGLSFSNPSNYYLDTVEQFFFISLFAVFLIIYSMPLLLKIQNGVLKRVGIRPLSSLVEFFNSSQSYFQTVLYNPFKFLQATSLGIIFQLSNVCGNFLISQSLGINVNFWDWAWVMTLLTICLLLPITVGGLGLREASLSSLFLWLGLDISQAVAFSIVAYSLLLINALIGYIIDLMEGNE